MGRATAEAYHLPVRYLIGFTAIVVVLAFAAPSLKVDGEPVADPLTVLTVGLVIATVYYAYQTWRLADVSATQARASTAADLARQREVQILSVEPFLAPSPTPSGILETMGMELKVGSSPALHLTVTLRAMAEQPDPGSTDGRSSQSVGLGSQLAQASVKVEVPIARFHQSDIRGRVTPYEDVWEVEILYQGILGQRMLETYEWRFGDQLRNFQRSWWQLRRLQIQPDVPGAESVDLRFGDE